MFSTKTRNPYNFWQDAGPARGIWKRASISRVLVDVVCKRQPELYIAEVCSVPLLGLHRYNKMLARIADQGHRVLYWENTEGGRGAAVTNEQRAYREALVYAYLYRQLFGTDTAG